MIPHRITPKFPRQMQWRGWKLELITQLLRASAIREGGSIPVVSLLKQQLGIDRLLIGFGDPDDRLHSPNEKFVLDNLYHGTRTAAALYARLAEQP